MTYIVKKICEYLSQSSPKYASATSPSSTNYKNYIPTCMKYASLYLFIYWLQRNIKHINSLKPQKNYGYDIVKTLLINQVKFAILLPLSKAINKLMGPGVFPVKKVKNIMLIINILIQCSVPQE